MKRVLGLLIALLATFTIAQNAPARAPSTHADDWYANQVFYQVFVRSFQDSNGDGVGDLKGLTERLGYIKELGATALWLLPIYPSPSYHGYDVTDYQGVNAQYGTMQDFDAFLTRAHELGLKVILDWVPNHTSVQHPWFTESQNPSSPKRDWYVWRDQNPGWGRPWGAKDASWYASRPGGAGFYYGAFWEGMPDLNYRNPSVVSAMQEAMRFWLQKGVDGFRLDAISYIYETDTDNAPHNPLNLTWMRDTASFVKSVKPDAMLVGEVWDKPEAVSKYFVNGDGEDLGFDFELRDAIRAAVNGGKRAPLDATLNRVTSLYPPSALDAIFTTNHDMVRPQYFGPVRYRIAASLLLTLPGVPFIYYGDEISMPNGPSSDDKDKRTPMRWDSSPKAGFTTGTPWQAFSTPDAGINVSAQREKPESLWNHYRNLIRLRQSISALRSGGFEPVPAGDRILAFVRRLRDQAVIVALNLDSIDSARVSLDLRGTSLEHASGTVQELTLDKTLTPKTVAATSYPVQLAPGGLVVLDIR